MILPFPVFPRTIEFPLFQSMNYIPFSENTILPKGKFSLTLDCSYSNLYRFNGERTIFNDMEVLGGIVNLRYGLNQNDTLEIYFRYFTILGGFLDRFIEDFHKFFLLPGNYRDQYPRNKVHYWFNNYYSYDSNQSGVSHIIIGYYKNLWESGDFSIRRRLAIGIPVSNRPGLSSGKPFGTGGLVFTYSTSHFFLEYSYYITLLSKPSWLIDQPFRGIQLYSHLEITWARFIGGFNFNTSVFKKDNVAHNAYQGFIGYRIAKNIDFLIMEDFAPFDTTPDIGFNIRFRVLRGN